MECFLRLALISEFVSKIGMFGRIINRFLVSIKGMFPKDDLKSQNQDR